MPHRYTTAFSHLVLAGTGMYCLSYTGVKTFHFPQAFFEFITINSLIGVWRWGNPDYGDDADFIYSLTRFLQKVYALPCITTTIWLNFGYMWQLAYIHTFSGLIPSLIYLVDGFKEPDDTIDLLLAFNVISLGVVSFLQENYFGLATAFSFTFNHFGFGKKNVRDIPEIDLYNYGMCFVTFFALKSLIQ